MKNYKPRIADALLSKKLLGRGAVLIEGTKWCGKTTTANQVAKSILKMDDLENKEQNLLIARLSPLTLLEGDTPRLIDEWQLAPSLWDAVRFEVDQRQEPGQFILTGSAVPLDKDAQNLISHSGTGRFSWLKMRPMSLYESGESNGAVSLENLFSVPEQIVAANNLGLEDIAYLICRGGWPWTIGQAKDIALDAAFDYYDAIVNVDISRVDGVARNQERVKRLLRSYARHQGATAPITTIVDDMKVNDLLTLDEDTVSSYLNALKKMFVIEESPAWNPNLRSKTAIRTSNTRYFVDPSIAVASLGIGTKDLLADLNTMGLLFETLCVRDLRVYGESLLGNVYHFRDAKGLECDAVIHLRNGSYGLIEIKLGGILVDEGAKSLLKLSNKIDTQKMKAPSFLMVLTAVGAYAYRREDGVYVVPIGCLKN